RVMVRSATPHGPKAADPRASAPVSSVLRSGRRGGAVGSADGGLYGASVWRGTRRPGPQATPRTVSSGPRYSPLRLLSANTCPRTTTAWTTAHSEALGSLPLLSVRGRLSRGRNRMAFKRSWVRLPSAPFYHPHHSQYLALARLNYGAGS